MEVCSPTALNLLTREGAVAVTFDTILSAEQYSELFELTRDADTKVEMRSLLARIGREWDLSVTIDDA